MSCEYDTQKLECYIRPGWNGLPRTNTLAYLALLQVIKKYVLSIRHRAFPANIRQGFKCPPGTKRSSLFAHGISNEEKKFYKSDTWSQM
jgi:hypothetical protein